MSWTYFSDTTPKARKQYHCELCNLPIAVGERHVARRGAQDGEVATVRMHIECELVTKSWDEIDWETPNDPAEFRENLTRQKESK